MPNHVTSKCSVHGPVDEIERFRSTVFTIAPENHSDAGALVFDFDRIIPMPPSIKATEDETGGADLGMALVLAAGSDVAPFNNLGQYDWVIERVRQEAALARDASIVAVARVWIAKNPALAEMGRNRLRAVLETGYTYWYSWNIANWGTKWGAYRCKIISDATPLSFKFETAWSFPTPIFEVLQAQYPLLSFECATFDEGSNFAGEGWFNPPVGTSPFHLCDASEDLYERVYDEPMPVYEDEE